MERWRHDEDGVGDGIHMYSMCVLTEWPTTLFISSQTGQTDVTSANQTDAEISIKEFTSLSIISL